ncbi:tryptophan halogenase family protein [Roseateles sp. NT4]|uniref:tryptophan halogenase family protein n=1 Tax=Roseateles sp. NT4 TaxID=3453715 RepID=UPI003EED42AD
MQQNNLNTVVIVGGGTAGWMTAAALAKVTHGRVTIQLVESEEIGTVGVGESTIPMIRHFNQLLGIAENEFMRETQATFKLGIELCDWGALGDRYLHAFGQIGHRSTTLAFHHYWLRMHRAGLAPDLWAHSINGAAARAQRFMRADSSHGPSPLAEIVHAFHIDAGLYARHLRRYAEKLGVQRTEGRVLDAQLHAETGHVRSVRMAGGALIEGDLFIDCSGFRGLLIEQTLKTGYEPWNHWLPCDRAVVVPSASGPDLLPFTRATARPAGWQWRIGLQHRTGNGHVYSSQAMGDDEAAALLMRNLDGEALAEPRVLRFESGRRRKVWNRNVVAIGLASGFMEPLESTSLHLVQSAISRLIQFFPDQGFNAADVAEFNRQSDFETERIRDFLILHYHATTRSDTSFWNHVRTMDVPDTLQNKLDLWRASGRIVRHGDELFSEVGWLQVLHGQGIRPAAHHPLADALSESEINDYLEDTRAVIQRCVAQMPSHADFIQAHCAAAKDLETC